MDHKTKLLRWQFSPKLVNGFNIWPIKISPGVLKELQGDSKNIERSAKVMD